VVDVRGNVVGQGNSVIGQNELNLNQLVAGAYVLRVFGEETLGAVSFVRY
jgi:hypothetical protein